MRWWELDQWTRCLTHRPVNLSFIPGAHVKVEGKNWLHHAVLWCTYTMPHKHVHTCTIVKTLIWEFQVCICFPYQLQFLESTLCLTIPGLLAETYLGGCLSWMAVILKGKGKFIVDHQSLTHTHSEKSIPVLWHKSCGNCEKQKLVPVRTLYAFIHRKIWKHRETVTSGSLRRMGMGTEEPIWTPARLHCLNVFLPLLTSFFIFNHE